MEYNQILAMQKEYGYTELQKSIDNMNCQYNLYKSIFNYMPDIVLKMNDMGDILFFNKLVIML
jgi:signal transduction histidine kinase